MNTTPASASPVDMHAARLMWQQYAVAHPERARLFPDYTVERFGDSPELADALLHEVLHGTKRATSGLAAEYLDDEQPLPRIGSHWIACDGAGKPRVILQSTWLKLGTFKDADADFARDEGEDDKSLESWQREHARYWKRTEAAQGRVWNEETLIVFERFVPVWPETISADEF